jgi:hypothetical protein
MHASDRLRGGLEGQRAGISSAFESAIFQGISKRKNLRKNFMFEKHEKYVPRKGKEY